MQRLSRWCYSTIFWLIIPFLLCHLLWKGHANPNYRKRWRERFGRPAGLHQWSTDGILLHAVSVGELNAARPVIDALLFNHPQLSITITTTTPTASQQVQAWFGDQVQHAYLPFDVPLFIGSFLAQLKPRLVLIMETEIWPNLFFYAQQHGAVLTMLNARLSRRTAQHYRWLTLLVRPTLQCVNWLGAQSRADASRLIKHGAQPSAVEITGNLKFDLQPRPQTWQRTKTLQAQLQQRLVWLAGSTHEGEELVLLRLFAQLQTEFPNLLLILAPRHPDRAEKVYNLCQQYDLHTVRYTHSQPIDNQAEVIILDIIGQLLSWYGAADIAFLGGTLVPIGGHNPIEPAAMGCPVIVGPNRENIAETADRLSIAKAAILIDQETELPSLVQALLADPERRQQMGQRAQRLVASESGGLEKTLNHLNTLLNLSV